MVRRLLWWGAPVFRFTIRADLLHRKNFKVLERNRECKLQHTTHGRAFEVNEAYMLTVGIAFGFLWAHSFGRMQALRLFIRNLHFQFYIFWRAINIWSSIVEGMVTYCKSVIISINHPAADFPFCRRGIIASLRKESEIKYNLWVLISRTVCFAPTWRSRRRKGRKRLKLRRGYKYPAVLAWLVLIAIRSG